MEEMRLDVVRRRCRVAEEEVNVLTASLTSTTETIKNIKGEQREGTVTYVVSWCHAQKGVVDILAS